jgi:2'-5' RNA ligase
METKYPAGIVLEIPEPIRSRVQAIRESLGTITARLPVEITVAGSSGLGGIVQGTDIKKITTELERVASKMSTFEVSFAGIRSFPNTSVVYLAPLDRKPFDSAHEVLRSSSIPFRNSPFPFTPHCTLRDGKPLPPEEISRILATPFPRDTFLIDTISVYEFSVYEPEEDRVACNLMFSRKLSPNPSLHLPAILPRL